MPEEQQTAISLLGEVCDAVNRGDVDALCACYTPSCTVVDASYLMQFGGEPVHGHDGLRVDMERMWTAFPDCHFALRSVVEAGLVIAAEVDIAGTHRGEFLGRAPTGRRVTWMSYVVYQRDEPSGCLASEVFFYDLDGVLAQVR